MPFQSALKRPRRPGVALIAASVTAAGIAAAGVRAAEAPPPPRTSADIVREAPESAWPGQLM